MDLGRLGQLVTSHVDQSLSPLILWFLVYL